MAGVWLLFLMLFATPFSSTVARADFAVPALTGPVVDQAGVIDPAVRANIEDALYALRNQGGTQINVLTVRSLEGLAIEEASIKVVDAWKLGGAKVDNGVLFMIAPNEHKVRIEVGRGLEGTLTDLDSKRIISEAVTPLFKSGDISRGILVGVYQIAQKTNPEIDLKSYLNGAPAEQPDRQVQGGRISPGGVILFIIVLFILMSTGFGRALLWGLFLSGFGGGGRGGGGGGGGRGGWGGGGGGFSGGGASGDW